MDCEAVMDVYYDAKTNRLFLVGFRDYDMHDIIETDALIVYVGIL